MKRNAGSTLIEIIVTMSVASTLMLLATAWIHQSFFLASKTRQRSRHHDSLVRLSRQFREDTHAAQSVKVIDEANVRMSAQSGTIQYQFSSQGVMRTDVSNDDETIRSRDAFRLSEGSGVTCTRVDDWLTLKVKRPTGQRVSSTRRAIPDGATSPTDLHVRARVGRWAEVLP
jgi:Tfp pilus assembly protein FimT